jgi:hypothetical protein
VQLWSRVRCSCGLGSGHRVCLGHTHTHTPLSRFRGAHDGMRPSVLSSYLVRCAMCAMQRVLGCVEACCHQGMKAVDTCVLCHAMPWDTCLKAIGTCLKAIGTCLKAIGTCHAIGHMRTRQASGKGKSQEKARLLFECSKRNQPNAHQARARENERPP